MIKVASKDEGGTKAQAIAVGFPFMSERSANQRAHKSRFLENRLTFTQFRVKKISRRGQYVPINMPHKMYSKDFCQNLTAHAMFAQCRKMLKSHIGTVLHVILEQRENNM